MTRGRPVGYYKKKIDAAFAAGKLAGKKELVDLMDTKVAKGIYHKNGVSEGFVYALSWLKSQLEGEKEKEV